MDFKYLKIKGFGSIVEETEFELDRPGINIIRGKIGSGKTTILSSLYWCLFGLKLKDKSSINTWNNQQDDNYKGTKVELEFLLGDWIYNLVRCENYQGKIGNKKGGNGIFLFREDNPLELGKGKRNQQKNLEKLIGYSPELFTNAVIFGQKMKRIIEESGPKKKEIFEEAFDLVYLSEALDIVKKKARDEMESISELENKLDKLKTQLKSTKNLLKTQLELEMTFQTNKQDNLRNLSKRMEKLKTKEHKVRKKLDKMITYSSLFDLRKDKKELEQSISIHERAIKQSENNIKNINRNLKSLKENKCLECGSVLNKKKLKKSKKKYAKLLEEETKNLKSYKLFDFDKAIKDIEKVDKKINNIIKLESRQKNLKEILSDIYDCNEEFKKEKFKKLEIKSTSINDSIKSLRKEIRILKRQLKKAIKRHEITLWMVKDPLSNSGIKAYLLQELIESVNIVLEKYSETLQFLITFEIDMDSNNKDFRQYIEIEDGQLVDYYDLSGGQRQLVDTSVALAINEVIGSIKPTNILFMDEPFESLDKETVEIIAQLIHTKPSESSIFIITHQVSFTPLNSNEISVKRDKHNRTIIL